MTVYVVQYIPGYVDERTLSVLGRLQGQGVCAMCIISPVEDNPLYMYIVQYPYINCR